jgi:hypothetical protein
VNSKVLVDEEAAEDLLRGMRDAAIAELRRHEISEVLSDDQLEAITEETFEAIGSVLVKHIRTR